MAQIKLIHPTAGEFLLSRRLVQCPSRSGHGENEELRSVFDYFIDLLVPIKLAAVDDDDAKVHGRHRMQEFELHEWLFYDPQGRL